MIEPPPSYQANGEHPTEGSLSFAQRCEVCTTAFQYTYKILSPSPILRPQWRNVENIQPWRLRGYKPCSRVDILFLGKLHDQVYEHNEDHPLKVQKRASGLNSLNGHSVNCTHKGGTQYFMPGKRLSLLHLVAANNTRGSSKAAVANSATQT